MYNRYANNLYTRDRYSRYPSYGYYDDSFVNYGYYPLSSNNYWYGGRRRYRNYWEADDYSRYRTGRNRRNRTGGNRSDENNTTDTITERPEPPPEVLQKALTVEDINLHVKQNAKKCHTGLYECVREQDQCVVRRGEQMKVTLTFDRKYDVDKDDAKIMFSIGENPSEPKGTRVIFRLIEKKKKEFQPDEWGAKLDEISEEKVTILINIPVNCIIGRYNMCIKTYLEDDKPDNLRILNRECDQDIIILFNPWSKDDTVSMIPKGPLKEYILEDEGYLFNGYWKWPNAKPWAFGQFDKGILEAALYLLNAGFGGSPAKSMSDPIQVSRILAKMVNVQDDRGVLVGNWSGEYDDGTSPTKWVGSAAILQQYMGTEEKPEKEPVKYGQCWVFSAVLTTVCRALGIPTRSVTCFASAHDTDNSVTIDKFFDSEGDPIEYMNRDSVWNFHVWNECWFRRTDLEEQGFHGWQVIDATPQEMSDGVYTCGPCPVAAVKRGRVDLPYDTCFVYGEVNADEVNWKLHPNGELTRLKIETDGVGKSLYTKNPDYDEESTGSKKGINVAHEYKYPEGSAEERKAQTTAHRLSNSRRDVYSHRADDAEIEFALDFPDTCMIGEPLVVSFVGKHRGEYVRQVKKPSITFSPMLYTGRVGRAFEKRQFDDFEMKPKEKWQESVTLTEDLYYKHLVEGAYIHISASCYVPKYDQRGRVRPAQTVQIGKEFKFEKPTLHVTCPKEVRLGKTFEFQVDFKNPLSIPLTNCNIDIVASGFDSPDYPNMKDIPQADVPAKTKYLAKFSLTPKRSGRKKRHINASFECKELIDIIGECMIRVVDDEDDA